MNLKTLPISKSTLLQFSRGCLFNFQRGIFFGLSRKGTHSLVPSLVYGVKTGVEIFFVFGGKILQVGEA